MKHLIFTFFILTVFVGTKSYAQNDKEDKIKSLKIGFITQKLDLTSKEAQGFWPIYNVHQDKIRSLHSESRKLKMNIRKNGGFESISNKEAETLLNTSMEIETKIHKEEIRMYKNLKSILPAKKILKLHRAEKDFNRKILEQLKKRRGNFTGRDRN